MDSILCTALEEICCQGNIGIPLVFLVTALSQPLCPSAKAHVCRNMLSIPHSSRRITLCTDHRIFRFNSTYWIWGSSPMRSSEVTSLAWFLKIYPGWSEIKWAFFLTDRVMFAWFCRLQQITTNRSRRWWRRRLSLTNIPEIPYPPHCIITCSW